VLRRVAWAAQVVCTPRDPRPVGLTGRARAVIRFHHQINNSLLVRSLLWLGMDCGGCRCSERGAMWPVAHTSSDRPLPVRHGHAGRHDAGHYVPAARPYLDELRDHGLPAQAHEFSQCATLPPRAHLKPLAERAACTPPLPQALSLRSGCFWSVSVLPRALSACSFDCADGLSILRGGARWIRCHWLDDAGLLPAEHRGPWFGESPPPARARAYQWIAWDGQLTGGGVVAQTNTLKRLWRP
jgi:hypothetical protein